jgi:signal transduction histidine kinase
VIEAGVAIEFEEAVPTVEGERQYISSKFLLRDQKGKPYAVCGIATDITELKRAQAMHDRRACQAALRADVRLAFSDALESGLQIVLQRCAEAVVHHLDAAFARIWTLNAQENVLELQASAGQYTHLDGKHARITVGELKIGLIAQERKPHLTNDVQNDERISHPEWARKEGMRSFAGHPLIVEGRLVGVLAMFARKELEPDALEALAYVADTIAQGIDRKVAAEKIREHAVRLSRAHEVLRRSLDALAGDKRLQSFVDQILLVLTEQLGGHSSTLWLIDVQERKAHLHSICQDGRVVVAENSNHPNAHEPREWSTDDPVWIALQMRRPFLLHDPIDDPQLRYTPAQRATFVALDIRALVLIPLVFGDQLIGLLSVRMAGNRQVEAADLEFAHSLAQQATLALEMARLAERAKQTALATEREKAARDRAAQLAKANEALRGCLDVLASVPELDEFLGQVMGAITRQLGAASSVLRLRNFEKNVLTLDLVFQDGRVMTPAEAHYPENLRTIPLDERQLNLLKQPVAVVHLLEDVTPIPDAFRAYLLGLGVRTSLVIPLMLARQLVGSLTFRFSDDREFRPEELEIARALASQASLAIHLTRLAQGARQSAVFEERNQLAGEIHDSLAQMFTGISLQLGAVRKIIKRGGKNSLTYVERAIELAQFGLAEARRTAFSLQPTLLEESGLIAALQKLVERSNIPGRLHCNFSSTGIPEESLPPYVQKDLLRIAQEAMSNAVRHAKPTVVNVSLSCESPNLVLEITDNGFGIANPQAAFKEGFGLSSMQARAEQLGAQLDVQTSKGRGTSIVVRLPSVHRL